MANSQYNNGTNSTYGANLTLHASDRVGIMAANDQRIYRQFASKKFTLPQRNGKTFKTFRKQNIYDRQLGTPDFLAKGFLTGRDIADVTAGLTAAGLPEGAGRQNLVENHIVALETTMARFGHMEEYTDEIDLFSDTRKSIDIKQELGDLAGRTYEDLLQRDMLATTNVVYPFAATSLATMGNGLVADGSLDSNYMASYDFFRRCVAKLKANRADKVTEMVEASVKISTKPVNKAYYCIIPSNVAWDIHSLSRASNDGKVNEFGFIPVEKYASQKGIAEGEIGAMGEVRFIESEAALVYRGQGASVPAAYVGTLAHTNNKFDVFPVLFPTKECIATVGLAGRDGITFHSQAPEQSDRTNPYGTVGFASYNFFYASIILKEEGLLKGLLLASNV
jgi:hypothetical protein